MRFLGAVLLMLVSSYLGFYAGGKVKKRCDAIRECVSLVQWFSSSIAYADEPLSGIIRGAVSSGEFKQLTFLQGVVESDLNLGFSQVWNSAIDEQKALDSKVSVLLKSFGAKLGRSDANDQLELCAYYKKEFEQLLAFAMQKQNEQIKLYRIAGSAIGALLFIIFV